LIDGDDLWEELDGTPALLAAERTRVLPEIVDKRKHHRLPPCAGRDARYRRRLLALPGARGTVALTCGRPSGLEIDAGFARAERIDDGELGGDEGAGLVGGDVGVEERMDVAADDVDDFTEDFGVFLPDVQGFGGGARTGVSGAGEGGSAGGDEGRQFGSGRVAREYALVSDDDQLDQFPLAPGDNVGYLLSGARDAGVADEDAENHLDPAGGAGTTDVLQTGAVGAVNTHGGEAFAGDEGNVRCYGAGVLAGAVVFVGGVGNGPLVSRGAEGTGWGGRGAGFRGGAGYWGGSCLDLDLDDSSGFSGYGSCWRGRSVWAEDDIVGFCDGSHDFGLGVGAWCIGRWDGVDPDGLGRANGGDGSDGVGTSRGADICGGQDSARDFTSGSGLNASVRADDRG
jgi:hypothetical protein